MNEFLEHLISMGELLDDRPLRLEGRTYCEWLIAEWLKVRDRDGKNVALIPNRAQAELERDPNRRKIVLKARQLGITTWMAARFFVRTITRPGTLTVQVAHDQESAEEIFKIVHRFLENLPDALRVDGVRSVRAPLRTSRSNVRQIIFPELDSEYRIETAADPNAGRGLTIQNLHCSEVARWPRNASATLASLRAAVPAGGEIVLESTPNGASGCFYEEWQRAEESGISPHFFPWWFEPHYAIEGVAPHPLSNEEAALAQRHGLRSAQIAYRRHLQRTFRALAVQEFCEDADSCFVASGECVFDLQAIEKRLAFCEQQYCERRQNGALSVWYPPASSRQYLIGVDPAGGGSEGDYACAQVIDQATGLQCAELCAHLPPQELAARLAELAREYNHALLVVERNNHGHAVLAHLASSAGDLSLYERNGQLGWLTTAANRPQMIAGFTALLAHEPHLFNSGRLLQQCRTFVRHANGAASASAGAHDDCVMAMAIAIAAREQGCASQSQNGQESRWASCEMGTV